jgi:isoleucyl-tRNA synthetase
VLSLLREKGRLVHQEAYVHSYPFCWRSKTPVIFRAMDQWFIEIDHVPPKSDGKTFRELALEEIERVTWVPDWGKTRIEAAVKSRPDWCISRQRSWGVPIPAFYDQEGRAVLDAKIVRKTADLVEKQGSNVWFEKSLDELWAAVKPEHWQGPAPAAKSNDTLDVWIDSGSSSRAVIMQREELRRSAQTLPPWQADMYLEGSDQHRGWFQSSLLLSLAANGTAPYRKVLTHGFMVDADREKISKSKQGQGGYEKPQTADAYVQKHGADVVRLWVASQDFRNDIVVSEERIAKVGETYRMLRNTLRYQLSNLYDFDPARHAVPESNLTGLDRWILAEFSALEQEVNAAYGAYEFHVVYQRLSQFTAVELSAVYHDIVKDRLYTDPANSARRRSTQTTLHLLVAGLCKMLAPIIAFTADEAWSCVPGTGSASVHESDWAPKQFELSAEEKALWDKLFVLRSQALLHLEQARQAKIIGKALEAQLRITGPASELRTVTPHREELRELLNVSALEVELVEGGEGVQFSLARAGGTKCERCWHWEQDVGAEPRHAALCGRCVRAIAEIPGLV